MSKDERKVVGIGYRTSKAGKPYYMLQLTAPFSDEKYGIGEQVFSEYVTAKNYPAGLMVGDIVELTYGRGFDGQAYVNGVHVVRSIQEKGK